MERACIARINRGRGAITTRSIIIGALLCVVINVGEPYIVGYVHGSPLAADFSTGWAIFLIFVVSLLINLPLRSLAPRFALSRSELLVCYIMMIVSCAVPSWGFAMMLAPWIAAPTYYATPENRWNEYIIPHLPENYFVLKEETARKFFEGLGKGDAIPWEVWIGPLARWAMFILCFYLFSVCVMVLLRRQWVGYERLTYPLAQMPLAVMPEGRPGRRPSYRTLAFWLGMAVPIVVYSMRGLNAYFPDVPVIPLGTFLRLREFMGFYGFNMSLRMPLFLEVVGLSFLLSTDMPFSLWFFAFLAFTEQGIINSLGTRIGPGDLYRQPGGQEVSNQALGAMLVLVAACVWRARSHLKRTLLAAVRAQ